RSCRGSEEYDCTGNFHRLPNSMKRCNSFDYICTKCWIRERLFGTRRGDKSRRHGIDCDVVSAPFDGETLCEVRNARFGHAIDRLRWQGSKSSRRTQIDDATIFLPHHDPPRSLTDEERPFEVDAYRLIEIFL